jgi:hypothetical protein
MADLARYKPSGEVSASFWPRLLVSLVGAVLLAGIYEFLLFLVPWIYVTVLIVLGFGFALSMLGIMLVDAGKCRSTPLAVGSTMVISLVGLIASYGWNYRRFLSAALAANPDLTFSDVGVQAVPVWLSARIESGWLINHEARDGLFFVGTMWALEAIIVLGMSVILLLAEPARPFCEACSEWTKSEGLGLPGVGRGEVEALLEKGDLRTLVQLEPTAESAPDQTRMVLSRSYCARCTDTAFLSVSEVSYHRGPKGEMNEKKHALATNLVLAGDLSSHFAKRIEKRDAAP